MQQCKRAKGLGEIEYKAEGAVINKYTLGQLRYCSHRSETAVPISQKNAPQEKSHHCLDGVERYKVTPQNLQPEVDGVGFYS